MKLEFMLHKNFCDVMSLFPFMQNALILNDAYKWSFQKNMGVDLL